MRSGGRLFAEIYLILLTCPDTRAKTINMRLCLSVFVKGPFACEWALHGIPMKNKVTTAYSDFYVKSVPKVCAHHKFRMGADFWDTLYIISNNKKKLNNKNPPIKDIFYEAKKMYTQTPSNF